MSNTASGVAGARYIIRSTDDKQLAEFLDEIRSDPEIELVDTIGPKAFPHTAVVTISPEKASALKQRFRASTQLTIEPDQPLSLFEQAAFD